ncbi:hypothetical protein L2E82_24903 [Cichorium intybus]|uniref:Uncharacterized protein n=1 Tax=Cichorium intybus TaxID=13427 RepID=A0ACB9E1P8_CICIN|nr:hypothetical protein L2E82_24903 [Cichorium intybus]
MNLDRLWYGSSPDLILIYTSFGLDLHRIWFEFGLDLHRLSFGSPPDFLSIILIPCFIYTGFSPPLTGDSTTGKPIITDQRFHVHSRFLVLISIQAEPSSSIQAEPSSDPSELTGADT